METRKNKAMRFSAVLGVSVLLIGSSAHAAYARYYSNVPTHMNILQGTINSQHSDNATHDEIPIEQHTRSNTWVAAYIYTLPGFTGNAAGLGVVVPHTSILGYNSQNTVTNDTSDVGDISLTLDYNFFGAKAMSIEEFARTPATTYGGIHFVWSLPTGSYDSTKTNNIGSNRYSLKTTYNQSFTWDEGESWLEFYFSGRIFSDNDEYMGNNTLSQEPAYGFETHYSHNLTPAVWVEAGTIWSGGGAVKINNNQVGTSQNNWQGVVGFGTKTWKGGSIIGTYNQTFARDSDDADTKLYMLTISHIF